jgi:hypothetical protein
MVMVLVVVAGYAYSHQPSGLPEQVRELVHSELSPQGIVHVSVSVDKDLLQSPPLPSPQSASISHAFELNRSKRDSQVVADWFMPQYDSDAAPERLVAEKRTV